MKNSIYNVEMKLSSNINSIRLVEPVIFNARTVINFDDTMLYNILIAVTEAVNNAIVHGNKYDETKFVGLSVHANSDGMDVEVTDQGSGFSVDNVEDPRSPQNILKTSGRGIFIIRELASSCDYFSSVKGTKVTMKFLFKKDK